MKRHSYFSAALVLALMMFVVGAVSMCATVADAEITVKFYRETNGVENIPGMKDYIVGVGRGIFWSSIFLETHGGAKIFCLPHNLAFDEGIILSVLDQEVRQPSSGVPWKDGTPIDLILVAGLSHKFPCNS